MFRSVPRGGKSETGKITVRRECNRRWADLANQSSLRTQALWLTWLGRSIAAWGPHVLRIDVRRTFEKCGVVVYMYFVYTFVWASTMAGIMNAKLPLSSSIFSRRSLGHIAARFWRILLCASRFEQTHTSYIDIGTSASVVFVHGAAKIVVRWAGSERQAGKRRETEMKRGPWRWANHLKKPTFFLPLRCPESFSLRRKMESRE